VGTFSHISLIILLSIEFINKKCNGARHPLGARHQLKKAGPKPAMLFAAMKKETVPEASRFK